MSMRLARHHSGPCVTVAVLAVLLALAPPAVAQAPAGPAPAVGTVVVAMRDVTQTAAYVGRVQAMDKVDLRARIVGFLENRLFQEGQRVEKDAPLFVIEQAPYKAVVAQREAALASAQATLKNADLQVSRGRELVRTNNIPQATLDQRIADQGNAAAAVMEAEAALQSARIDLSYTGIYAPFAGRIGRSNFSVGNVVGPDSGILATLVSTDPMHIYFPMPQRSVVQYQRTAEASGVRPPRVRVLLTRADGSRYPHAGELDFADVQVDRGTDTLTLRATIPNPDVLLFDGEFANITLEGATPERALVIPQAALLSDQSGTFVFVVENGRAVPKRVKLGQRLGAEISVTEGLTEGAQVIVEGIQRVRPNAPVQATPAQAMPRG
jgi:membrane fusion protein (multidrug efflux system)